MKDSFFTLVLTFIGGIALLCCVMFGYACLYVFIPLSVIGGVLFWHTSRDYEGKRDWSNAINITIGLLIISFVLTFVGSCIGGCTKGGGDTTQQRIEMGVPLY